MLNEDLVNKAHSALGWCVEVISIEDRKRGYMLPEHTEKIEEINKLMADLASIIEPVKADNPQPGNSTIRQVKFTLADGREFCVTRL